MPYKDNCLRPDSISRPGRAIPPGVNADEPGNEDLALVLETDPPAGREPVK